jgi:hypothetical protein
MIKCIDYSDSIAKAYGLNNILAAHGKNDNVLILSKLDEPMPRVDGRRVSYNLEYRWLSCSCENENDEAWVCVRGSEDTYWSKRELIEAGVMDRNGNIREISLFDCFRLFP